MGLSGAGAEARLDFAVSDVNGQNALELPEELNETLNMNLHLSGYREIDICKTDKRSGMYIVKAEANQAN